MALVVKNSIGKYLFYALIALIFVAGGIFILSVGKDLKATIIGWSCLILFGFGLLVFLRQIFDTRPRIVIDQNGIFDRTLGVGIIDWADIEHAYLNSIMGNNFISLVLHDNEKYLQRASKSKAKLAKYNRALGFETINLNLSGVNVKTKDIFDFIIKQLTAEKIKNLKNLPFEVKLQNPDKKNVVSDRSSDS
jgi:hypothetical protein